MVVTIDLPPRFKPKFSHNLLPHNLRNHSQPTSSLPQPTPKFPRNLHQNPPTTYTKTYVKILPQPTPKFPHILHQNSHRTHTKIPPQLTPKYPQKPHQNSPTTYVKIRPQPKRNPLTTYVKNRSQPTPKLTPQPTPKPPHNLHQNLRQNPPTTHTIIPPQSTPKFSHNLRQNSPYPTCPPPTHVDIVYSVGLTISCMNLPLVVSL